MTRNRRKVLVMDKYDSDTLLLLVKMRACGVAEHEHSEKRPSLIFYL